MRRHGACILWLAAQAWGLAPPPRRFGGRRFGAAPGDDDGALAFLTRRRLYAAAGVAGGAAACSSRSLRRTVRFQGGAARIAASYARYGVATRVLRREGDLEAVHELTGARLETLVGDMRGAYVKSAQLLSTAFPELMPAAWVRRLERMVDDAPPRPWAVTRRVLERELGTPVDDAFASFDRAPVGAASIGQVHRAVVRGTNATVAVKIQSLS